MGSDDSSGSESYIDIAVSPKRGKKWAFIAVMGVTGAGKSTFIQTATNNDVEIGHGLESCTGEIKAYNIELNGMTVSLVDTPGFNDTYKSETEVLQDIATWLADTYASECKLNGIVYIHSINTVRMEGSALRNLKMFRKLCGDQPLKNVILATSFWGKVDRATAERREEELRSTPDFWGRMLRKGSRMERFTDRESALRIISSLLEKEPTTLRIQREMVEEDKPLIETAAGRTVNEELARVEEKHRREKAQLEKEMREALKQRDEELQEILQEQRQRMDRELEKVHRQQEQLRADRRAERRKLENDLEEAKRQINDQLAKVRDMTFDEAVAVLRANEGKLRPEDRERLEQKISEAAQQPEVAQKKSGKKRRGTAKYLIKALELAMPAVTLALFGFPVSLPFSSWFSSSDGTQDPSQ